MYSFPKIGGGETTKSLAPPTNRRIKRFLDAMGKASFSELLSAEGQINYSIAINDLAISEEKLREMLGICLKEPVDDIDLDDIDMRTCDKAIGDFFGQRSKMYLERSKL